MHPSDPHERLTEAAFRSIPADMEVKLAARTFISRIARTDDAAAVETAIARWDRAGKKRGPGWKTALAVLAVILSVAIATKDLREIRRIVKWGGLGAMFFWGAVQDEKPAFLESLTPSQRLLFAAAEDASPAAGAERLWRSEPDNPAYFREYAETWIAERQSLPPDFLETAARIDPDNAWFPYVASCVVGKDAYKQNSRKSRKVGSRRVYDEARTWVITDKARFDAALQLLRQTRSLRKCDNYTAEMLAKRVPWLKYTDLNGRMEAFTALSPTLSDSMGLRIAADVLSAKAWSLGEAGDVAGFRGLSADADHFLRLLCETPTGVVIDGMVLQGCAQSLSESLAYAAEKLALPGEAARWRGAWTILDELGQTRATREWIVDGKPVPEGTSPGGTIGDGVEMISRMARNHPPLTDADLKPGRMLEHDFFSRYCVYALLLLVATLAGFITLYRFRIARLPRILGARAQTLLTARDWAWIFGNGVLLPLVFVFSINLFTPLGGRFAGIMGTTLLMPLGHFIGLLMLWSIVTPAVIRWRLSGSARVLGITPPGFCSWISAACATALIPALGWMAMSGPAREIFSALVEYLDHHARPGLPTFLTAAGGAPFWITAFLFLVSLGWIVVSLGIAFFTPSVHQLRCAAISMALLPAVAFAVILLGISTLVFKSGERYWVAREKLFASSSAPPAWNFWEFQVSVQMRKELRQALGYEP